ncbi:6-phosphofructokinase [Pontibacter sp. G13]|uniref:6-phosphofructokinase n=1 Tax=Pontibacter sp. G13 TaxID=3074898 RepID=UPI00288BD4D3|nr:6-phosphofructokinase [Pontibacter sp. G13]WNJ16465.1 6-phosphofructokinase [Pontibacter sp. G13]
MKKIGVYTSGGDAPGMNACLRAVARAALSHGMEVVGIRRGYQGMIEGDFVELKAHSVSNIIQRGGTILKSSRSQEFRTPEGRQKAYNRLREAGVEGLVAIGGDGTFAGARTFYEEHKIPVVGCPGTIDNDLYGTDFTIGYDTALNTAMDAIDKIRDTADSHNRLFFIEVMGRDAGFIALNTGIASGAEAVCIPEKETFVDDIIQRLEQGWMRQKTSSIIVVAEGDDGGGAFEIAKKVEEKIKRYDTRVVILGHIQRGGSPTCMDRVLASRLGAAAVETLQEGLSNVMVGLVNGEIKHTSFFKACKYHQTINHNLLNLVEVLST